MAYRENDTGTTQTKPLPKDTKKKDVNKEDLHAQLEEDLALKQHLELRVERIYDVDPEVQKVALESMRQEVRTSISSMTYVPKLLKFLRPHYRTLKAFYETMLDSGLKKYLADILSVLALTMSVEVKRESLKYRLLGSEGDICSWGHEYVRILAGEISQEYLMRQSEDAPVDDLMELVEQIVAFHMKHNAESEAVDLLMEVDDLDPLTEHVDITNFRKTCLYLTSAARYLPDPDDILFMDTAYSIYLVFYEFASALQIALFLDNLEHVCEVFTSCDDLLMKKQFCYILARQGINFELDDDMVEDDEDRELSQAIINNVKLSEGYLTLARDIEAMEPKCPEDVYKTHLLDGRAIAGANVDTARENLAATFVNAFVNAGFGKDRLMTDLADSSSDGSSGNWLFKNKEHAKISVVASLGMILLWDVNSGLAQIDKYLHSDDNYVIAGALLGVGLVNCSVTNDYDPALALLSEYINKEDSSIQIGAIMGLGIAYAGAQDEQILNSLIAILKHENVPHDVIAFTAISLGLVFVGSSNGEVAQAITDALTGRSVSELGQPLSRLLVLALGLIYLGKQEGMEATSEVSKSFSKKMRNYVDITLLSCAHAGTGNVLTVQKLLGHCSHLENAETSQGSAVLGIAMVAMAEEAAVISLGLIGAGTNNARIAGMLRNLSSFYYNVPGLLFCVRIAQGLVHMGKGLLTLNPYHSNRLLCSPTALAGLVTMLHACLDMKSIILGKYHFVLYYLVLAMKPRMLMTLDKNLEPISVPVRVGEAVDVVGHPGQPKTITGFQTHSTPVLLAAGERAELATEKYVPLSPILEGYVILVENTEYMEDN
uniref:26S proteasome non-ATPase regulatory subunit 2 homolog n=1 Tax=Gossypium raimondii TaxID=29730 RepID=A0A0D2R0X5_GOSRA|nr:hypothetical protein B456_004G198500 [Gossypium raimondii]